MTAIGEPEVRVDAYAPAGDGYLGDYPRVWGRECGENGIGRLREVALTRITEAELQCYAECYPYHTDVGWLESQGLGYGDLARLISEQEHYASLLAEQGVEVHWIDWGEAPMSAFGPMQCMWAASDLWVIRGGSVIQKTGWHPFSFGRSEFLARWAQRELGVPVLHTVTGRGVHEPATTMFFAEDVWVTGISAAYNAEGNRQLEPVVRRSAGDVDLEVHTVHLSSDRLFDRRTGTTCHLTNVLCPLDVDKVLLFGSGVDHGTHRWLRERGYKVAEVELDEQVAYTPTNTVPLAPGVTLMVAEARKAIAAVRALGVEVVEVPNAEFSKIGGALHCRTLRVRRDPGPLRHG